MLARLLLLFIIVPLIELTLLLVIADNTNWQFTLGLVIDTGIVGSLLARSQGFRTYQRIQKELSAGQLPTDSLIDAAMIFFAGGLLLTPGVLTDVLGISLLVPFCQKFYRQRLVRWFKAKFQVQAFGSGAANAAPGRSEVIDSYVVDPPDETKEAPAADDRPVDNRGPNEA